MRTPANLVVQNSSQSHSFRKGQKEGATNDVSRVSSHHSSALVRYVANIVFTSPIPRSLHQFPDEATASEDWRYLQRFLLSDLSDHLQEGSSSIVVVRNINWYQHYNPCPVRTAFPWPGFSLSSKTFRYASLTFASCSATVETPETLQYLAKFYKFAQESISNSSTVEVASACYLILLYAYKIKAPLAKVLVHFKGICAAIASIHMENLSVHDQRNLKNIWQGSLAALRRAYWTTHGATSHVSNEELHFLGDIYSAFQTTVFMFHGLISQIGDTPGELRWKLDTLECYLAFYWDYYLALRCHTHNPAFETWKEALLSSLETSIQDVVHLIYAFVLQQPVCASIIMQASQIVSARINFIEYPAVIAPNGTDFEQVKATFLYCWAKIVENTLLSATPCRGSVHSALVLLRLIHRFSPTFDCWPWPMTPPLFWSCLSLKNDTCPSGTVVSDA